MLSDPVVQVLVIIFGIQALAFLAFYSREGMSAVYCARYAPLIDVCAIASGAFIMGLALYAYWHPGLFNFDLPLALVVAVFVLGSWQMLIHAVKWWLRVTRKKC